MNKQEGSTEKLTIIDETLTTIMGCISQLIEFSRDEDEAIRLQALEALQNIRTSDVEYRIREALSDIDELVRTTSLEILGAWKDSISFSQIVTMLADESWLVRSAAAIALAEIGDSAAVEVIESKLPCAEDEEKVRFFFALYKLGKHEYWPCFLNGLFHSFYRVRCATANLLPELVSPAHKDFSINLLVAVKENEETEAARSSIEHALEEIGRMEILPAQ